VFSAAGIARLDPIEMKAYDESLKVLWDNYSIIKTARKEGYEQGKAERIREWVSHSSNCSLDRPQYRRDRKALLVTDGE
jgi:hypothetical protein